MNSETRKKGKQRTILLRTMTFKRQMEQILRFLKYCKILTWLLLSFSGVDNITSKEQTSSTYTKILIC